MLNLRINLLIGLLIAAFAILQYHLWFESGGLRDMFKLKHLLLLQAHENDELKNKNEELLLQIRGLKNSEDAVEARARNELGMIKQHELFYQIVPDSKRIGNENSNQQ